MNKSVFLILNLSSDLSKLVVSISLFILIESINEFPNSNSLFLNAAINLPCKSSADLSVSSNKK